MERSATPGEAAVLARQKRVTTEPYYSKIRFRTTRSGAGPHTYTIAALTELQPFGYGLKDDMSTAGGFAAATVATLADTNIINRGRTISGQTLRIYGVALHINPNSNPRIAALLWPELSLRFIFNGQVGNGLNLGPPHLYPGAGGLYGAGEDNVGVQPLPGGRPTWWFPSHGMPGTANAGQFGEGYVEWADDGADSNLQFLIRNERAVAHTTQLADEAAAAGIRGFANPADTAVFVEMMVVLIGEVVGARSRVT